MTTENQTQDTTFQFIPKIEDISDVIKTHKLVLFSYKGFNALLPFELQQTFVQAMASEEQVREQQVFNQWLVEKKDIFIDELNQEFQKEKDSYVKMLKEEEFDK